MGAILQFVNFKSIALICVLGLGLTVFSRNIYADGGGLYELAKAHKQIFNQCYNKAKFQPGLVETDFAGVPAEDVRYLYIFNYNLVDVIANVEFAHHQQEIKCREWIPYLSHVYFYGNNGDEALIQNMQRRFCQEREFDLFECSEFKLQSLQ